VWLELAPFSSRLGSLASSAPLGKPLAYYTPLQTNHLSSFQVGNEEVTARK
jgi:hypothetical protein